MSAATLGEGIRQARKLLGLNQTELGDALGVSQSTVCNWEDGTYPPNPAYVQKIGEMAKDASLIESFYAEHGLTYVVRPYIPAPKTINALQKKLSETKNLLTPLENILHSLKTNISSLETELSSLRHIKQKAGAR